MPTPPARVLPPKTGRRIRIDRGRVDGVFYIDGHRTFRNLGLLADAERSPGGRSRTDAQITGYFLARWDERAREIQAALDARAGEGRPVLAVMAEWIEARAGDGLAGGTTDLNSLTAEQYALAVGDHQCGDISLAHVDKFRAWLTTRGLAPATINQRLSKLAAFIAWAARREYLHDAPPVDRVREKRPVPRIPQPEQIRALLDRIHSRVRDRAGTAIGYQYELHELMIVLVLSTGMRRGEPLGVRWSDIDLERGIIIVDSTKEGAGKAIVLPWIAVEYLRARRQRYPDHTWLFNAREGQGQAYTEPHAVTTAIRRHMAAAGLAGLHLKPIHSYRANVATIGVDTLGLDPASVQAQLGHASLRTTQRSYVATQTGSKRRSADAYETGFLDSVFDRKLIEDMPALKR